MKAAGVSVDAMAATASAGLVKCATYAVAVNGASDVQIQDTRSAVHASAFPRPAGRSLTADVQLTGRQAHGVDPAIDMASSPIITWAIAWWEAWIPHECAGHHEGGTQGESAHTEQCNGARGGYPALLQTTGMGDVRRIVLSGQQRLNFDLRRLWAERNKSAR